MPNVVWSQWNIVCESPTPQHTHTHTHSHKHTDYTVLMSASSVSFTECRGRSLFTVPGCLNAPIRRAGSGWPKWTTSPRTTWTRRMSCCWTPGRRWEVISQPSVGLMRGEMQLFLFIYFYLFIYFFLSDFLMGWKFSQPVRDQGGVELCAGVPEDPPSKTRPRHTHHLCQRGPRTAHLHRLVQCLGSS